MNASFWCGTLPADDAWSEYIITDQLVFINTARIDCSQATDTDSERS